MSAAKAQIIAGLQQDILLLQGIAPPPPDAASAGLGPVEGAFPNAAFPRAALHEFVSTGPEEAAAAGGFICGLLTALMKNGSIGLWVGRLRTVFPPALKLFGVDPDRIIFVDLEREKDVLWVAEEALKCTGLAAVVAELPEMSFSQSRRLQLAVEKSRVTGFMFRHNPREVATTACAARWRITPLPSVLEAGMPGVGHPRWNVELLKVRNGKPGAWQLEWYAGGFRPLAAHAGADAAEADRRKAG